MTDPHAIRTEAELRALHPEPSEVVKRKCADRLDANCRRFIALSPFLALATANAAGRADVSPRGDAPGFVRVLDPQTLLVPDRAGNNLHDSNSNILANPEIGLLFLIPGIDETLRVNGTATLTRDPALLETLAVDGKAPKLAVRVSVREVFLHCARAFRRARLWDPASFQRRDALPPIGTMIKDMASMTALDPAAFGERYDAAMKTLY